MTATPAAPALVVEQLGRDLFRVSGGRDPHVVEIRDEGDTCDCSDFAFRGRRRACKHLVAVWDHVLKALP